MKIRKGENRMKVISTNNQYIVYGDDLKTYDNIPADIYTVRFSRMSGFYLEKVGPFEIKESKIYGVHLNKIDKVARSFTAFDRSLGVILSGAKGIGKSLFAKLLCNEEVSLGYPVLMVDTYYPGIADYLESLKQEVVVFFDEFDKTFKPHDNENPQEAMLSLFDGTTNGKKLFVITCNSVNDLNDYLINRPGRFHYHFRFEYPSAEEIKEYLNDKLDEKYKTEIDEVIHFSKRVNLNYDCLRAIAFELNMGYPLKEAILDLNIINTDRVSCSIKIYANNGKIYTSYTNYHLDLFSDDYSRIEMKNEKNENIFDFDFNPQNLVYDENLGYIIPGNKIDPFFTYDDEDEDCGAEIKELRKVGFSYAEISKKSDRAIHYLL